MGVAHAMTLVATFGQNRIGPTGFLHTLRNDVPIGHRWKAVNMSVCVFVVFLEHVAPLILANVLSAMVWGESSPP